MGMSTHVVGIKPADDHFRNMKKVYLACKEAGINPPLEVEDFFDGKSVEVDGIEVSMSGYTTYECITEVSGDGWSGYQIEIAKVPKDIKFIRVYNSW